MGKAMSRTGRSRYTLFQHEYGHYLQSKASGPMYLFKYAIPSLYSATFNDAEGHTLHPIEQDANSRAISHWEKKSPGFADSGRWKFRYNYIAGGYNNELSINDKSNQDVLKKNKIKAFGWGDLWRFPLGVPSMSYTYYQHYKPQHNENKRLETNNGILK